MEFEMEERKQQLSDMETFISETYSQIDEMLQSVGWSREYLLNEHSNLAVCPLNPEHKIPEPSFNKHKEICSWRQEGYHKLDVPLPENSNSHTELTKSSIIIDAVLQADIIKDAKEQDPTLQIGNLDADDRRVPKTSDRLMTSFTTDERRILYDYVVSKTKPIEDVKVEELHMLDAKNENKPRPKSKLELLIEERDAKRRRISYKKKVHTNRKSHTEIIREVIQNQMELVEQIIKGDCDDKKEEDSSSVLSNNHVDNVDGKNIHQELNRKVNENKDVFSENNSPHLSENTQEHTCDWKELPYKTKSKSKSHRDSERVSVESRRRDENYKYRSYGNGSSSTSHHRQDVVGRDAHYQQHYKRRESFGEYRSREAVKKDYHYYKSRRDPEDLEDNYSAHRRGFRERYSSEQKAKYKTPRHRSSSSEHDHSENELHRKSKHNKYSSKYNSPVHYSEFDSKNENNKFVCKNEDSPHSSHYSHKFERNLLEINKGESSTKNDEQSFQQLENKVDYYSDSTKYSEKSRKVIKKKKKKHKHKIKKKSKKKKHSSSDSTKSTESNDSS